MCNAALFAESNHRPTGPEVVGRRSRAVNDRMCPILQTKVKRRLNWPIQTAVQGAIPIVSHMFSSYEFGYSWFISYGLVVPLALAGVLLALAIRRGWRWWVRVLAGVVGALAVIGL